MANNASYELILSNHDGDPSFPGCYMLINEILCELPDALHADMVDSVELGPVQWAIGGYWESKRWQYQRELRQKESRQEANARLRVDPSYYLRLVREKYPINTAEIKWGMGDDKVRAQHCRVLTVHVNDPADAGSTLPWRYILYPDEEDVLPEHPFADLRRVEVPKLWHDRKFRARMYSDTWDAQETEYYTDANFLASGISALIVGPSDNEEDDVWQYEAIFGSVDVEQADYQIRRSVYEILQLPQHTPMISVYTGTRQL